MTLLPTNVITLDTALPSPMKLFIFARDLGGKIKEKRERRREGVIFVLNSDSYFFFFFEKYFLKNGIV